MDVLVARRQRHDAPGGRRLGGDDAVGPRIGLVKPHEPDPEVDRIVPPEAAAAAGVKALTASDEHLRYAPADPEGNLSSLAPYLGNRRVAVAIQPARAELEGDNWVHAGAGGGAHPGRPGDPAPCRGPGAGVPRSRSAPAEPLPMAGPLSAAEPPVT